MAVPSRSSMSTVPYCHGQHLRSSRRPTREGELDGEVVTCPWHSWDYNVQIRISLTDPSASLRTYEVKVEGEDVKILLKQSSADVSETASRGS